MFFTEARKDLISSKMTMCSNHTHSQLHRLTYKSIDNPGTQSKSHTFTHKHLNIHASVHAHT